MEYRKKENTATSIADTVLKKMELAYNNGNFETIANYYTSNAKVVGKNVEVSGQKELITYWKSFASMAGKWKLETEKAEFVNNQIWQKGTSIITDKNNKQHKVVFTLIIVQENNEWKILQDAYW